MSDEAEGTFAEDQISDKAEATLPTGGNLRIHKERMTQRMNDSVEFTTLAPGARLCAVRAGQFKTCRISVSIAAPLCRETAAANATLPFLLHRCCEKYPDFTTMNETLAQAYGARVSAGVEKVGEAQVMRVSLTCISDRFAFDGDQVVSGCVRLLCELLFHPHVENNAFFPQDVEREKRLLLERIENERNDKRTYALRRCEALMCENEAYGINRYGTPEEVERLTPEGLYQAWRSLLAQGRMQFNLVGDGSVEEAGRLLRLELSAIDREQAAAGAIQTQIVPHVEKTRRVEERLPVQQGKLVLGYRMGYETMPEDPSAVSVMVNVLGGSPQSLLFQNVREKLSLCYYCSARLFRQKGVMMVQSGVEFENAEQAIEEIGRQLDAVRAGDFTQDDFEASVKSLADDYERVGGTPEELDDWYAYRLLEEAPAAPQSLAEQIRAVTREQAVEAARKVALDTVYLLMGEEAEK